MKKVIVAAAATFVIVVIATVVVLLVLQDTGKLTKIEYFGTIIRSKAFQLGIVELRDEDIGNLFTARCATRCHGAGPIETSRHTSREWKTVIERMRGNGARVGDKEIEALAGYLQKHYGSNVPTILSPAANRFLKRYLWKSDFGESDLYVDIIYAPKEYFELMGGMVEGGRLAPERLVFMVYLNTHQDKLKPWPIKDLAALKARGGALSMRPLSWRVTYQSGDFHHMEGVLEFEKADLSGTVELVLSDLPGRKERLFAWELPIPAFEGGSDAH